MVSLWHEQVWPPFFGRFAGKKTWQPRFFREIYLRCIMQNAVVSCTRVRHVFSIHKPRGLRTTLVFLSVFALALTPTTFSPLFLCLRCIAFFHRPERPRSSIACHPMLGTYSNSDIRERLTLNNTHPAFPANPVKNSIKEPRLIKQKSKQRRERPQKIELFALFVYLTRRRSQMNVYHKRM